MVSQREASVCQGQAVLFPLLPLTSESFRLSTISLVAFGGFIPLLNKGICQSSVRPCELSFHANGRSVGHLCPVIHRPRIGQNGNEKGNGPSVVKRCQ